MHQRELIVTQDGSTSLYLPDWNESYHSKHGAVAEALHVFIDNGLALLTQNSVRILEIGFGTGLNAYVTALNTLSTGQHIEYVGVEGYPISTEEALAMNYPATLDPTTASIFQQLHQVAWEKAHAITPNFFLTKRQLLFQDIKYENQFDLIYFDAFGYRVQPDLWSEAMFQSMFHALKPNGMLVTYACRTIIKRAMESAGFTVEKCPGAPGKREMLRARKLPI